MNEGSGDVVGDSSGEGNNGTRYGATWEYIGDPLWRLFNIKVDYLRTFAERIVVFSNVVKKSAKTFVENITAGVNLAITCVKVFSETINVVVSMFNQAVKTFAETIKINSQKIVIFATKVLIEQIVVGIIYSQILTAARTLTEIVKVAGNALKNTGRQLSESVQAVDSIVRETGRIFNEVVSVGWSKIKLVLNGIQVGLWKKAARVTNGVWKKISRNDN